MKIKGEILAPAGSLEKMKVAFKYGADSVYLGGKAFNLRSRSSNFTMEEIEEGTAYAHNLGKKVYVALNILAHHKEISALPHFIRHLEKSKVDGVIVSDLGVWDLVKENSNLPLHVSTQASSTNWRAVKMWQQLGAKRVVLARELSLKEIREIKDKVPDIELEVFIHGAMCMTYSGRCNLSQYFSQRDGNRGACSHTCRWKYKIVEEKRPGDYYPVFEDETGTYIYNSKDLCTLPFLDQILDAGVTGLKIEGRMKTHYYVANTTKIYASALKSYENGSFHEWNLQEAMKCLRQMNHRGYTQGFFLGKDPFSEQMSGESYGSHRFTALVRQHKENNKFCLDIKEKYTPGQPLWILKPKGPHIPISFDSWLTEEGEEKKDVVQPGQKIWIQENLPLEPLDILLQWRKDLPFEQTLYDNQILNC